MEATKETRQDPLETGATPWQERAWELASTWAAGPGMTYEGIDLCALLEYNVVGALNEFFGAHVKEQGDGQASPT